ncbi:hypothetical protein D7W81_35785 [Corallococcus aberystwythensis]|uniref:Uncharacterized protein n=1 Tax=Corallococcus aberystwythensis TaxID=2316722 RepID=A0A3A8PH52_9BACT|nr:hypothetical protein D7W81_35785 [Corallococcus aberystwythensis]
MATPPATVAPAPPSATPTTANDVPAKVETPTPTKVVSKTTTKPGGKTQASRIPLEPTEAIAISDLKEARAAAARKDVDTAVRMAQRSYTAQKTLAAHYLAIKLRCQTRDMVNGPVELKKLPRADLTQQLIDECRSNGIELKK